MSVVKMFILIAMAGMDDIEIPDLDLPPIREQGLASWYGSGVNNDNGMHGRITATGEVFDPSLQTCAHRSIGLNTIIIVEDLETGRRTWCRISDRGPYGGIHDGEWVLKLKASDPGEWRGILDMSKGTAQALGVALEQGLFNIAIRYWGSAGPRYSIRTLN